MERKVRFVSLLCLLLMVLLLCACSAPLATLDADEIYAMIRDDTSVEGHDAVRAESGVLIPEHEQWYGYWKLTDAEGRWTELESFTWDCCAVLSGSGSALTVWDEDMSREYYTARLYLSDDDGLKCVGGDFLEESVTPSRVQLSYDGSGCLKISGTYSAEGEGSFAYSIYLRPWGDSWEHE